MSNDTISMDQLSNSTDGTIDLTKMNNDDGGVIDLTKMNSEQNVVIDLTRLNSEDAVQRKENIQSTQSNQPIRRKVSPTRKTADDVQIMSAEDLDAMMPKEEVKGPKTMEDVKDKAISALDNMIKRKQSEYEEFVAKAIEDDKLNKEKIKDGLEEAPSNELKYQVQDLPKSITNDPSAPDVVENENADDDDIEMDLELDTFEDDEDNDHNSSKVSIKLDEDILELDDDDIEDVDLDDETKTTHIDIPEDDLVEDVLEEDEENDKKERDAALESFEDELRNVDISNSMTVSAKIDIPDEDKGKGENTSTLASSDFDISEDDIEDDINAEPTEETAEEKLTDEQIEAIAKKSFRELRSEIIKKVINTSRKMDLKTLAISNKVSDVKSALKTIKNTTDTEVRTAVYPMMYANRNFIASSLKGPDIAMLVEADDARIENNPNILLTREQARVLYDHDANPYKPSTIESWAKTIPYGDIESIFAAIYLASLKKANYIPRQCQNERCQYSFLTDTLDIDSIVRFPNDDVKEKFNTIKKSELTKESSETYESSVSVINDHFAVGLKAPSIFTILYEYTALNNEFATKYSTMLYIMQYIDYLYLIDQETGELSRISWKSYPGDYGKTFKSKIATYAKILKEFDETDFTFILALVRSMETKNADNNIRYFIPKTRCAKCGNTIEEEEVSPRQLVFTRQRLVALATTPVEK